MSRTLLPNEPGDALGADIYVANADGSGRRRLANGPTQGRGDLDPFWSLDAGFGSADIFVVNADGSGLQRLTETPAVEKGPVWSPRMRSQ
jgi:Tol biopolymer transport system component